MRIADRAASWVSRLQKYGIPARMQHGESTVGGGSLPGESLPSTLLALDAGNVSITLDDLAKRLRLRNSPLIVRILRDALLVDPRTVLVEQDNEVVQAFVEELGRDSK
jgi:L-seryl-tRNA(Ser) seleniumtransferase